MQKVFKKITRLLVGTVVFFGGCRAQNVLVRCEGGGLGSGGISLICLDIDLVAAATKAEDDVFEVLTGADSVLQLDDDTKVVFKEGAIYILRGGKAWCQWKTYSKRDAYLVFSYGKAYDITGGELHNAGGGVAGIYLVSDGDVVYLLSGIDGRQADGESFVVELGNVQEGNLRIVVEDGGVYVVKEGHERVKLSLEGEDLDWAAAQLARVVEEIKHLSEAEQ